MELNRYDLKDGQQVWACAYSTNNSEKSMAFRKKPVLGVIQKSGGYNYDGTFYELKKNGEMKVSSGVKISARHYANTEEESKSIYNSLVKSQINFLQELLDNCKSDLI